MNQIDYGFHTCRQRSPSLRPWYMESPGSRHRVNAYIKRDKKWVRSWYLSGFKGYIPFKLIVKHANDSLYPFSFRSSRTSGSNSGWKRIRSTPLMGFVVFRPLSKVLNKWQILGAHTKSGLRRVLQMSKSAHCTMTIETKKAVWQVYSSCLQAS